MTRFGGSRDSGYVLESDHLAISSDGSIRKDKPKASWSDFHKSDICVIMFWVSISLCVAIGMFATAGILVKKQATDRAADAAAEASQATIMPRFPVMQLNAGGINGTQDSILTGFSTGTSTIHCADETSTEITTTVQKTFTQTRTLQESGNETAKGSTVSSTPAVTTTESVKPTASQPVEVSTKFMTTSVTKTSHPTETTTIMTTVQAPSVITEYVTATIDEIVMTTTHTPTTVILSTVTVYKPLTTSHEAECSPGDHTVFVTVTETPKISSSVSSIESEASSSSSVLISKSTGTILVTYTATVDSLTPPSKAPVVSSSSDVVTSKTTVTSDIKETVSAASAQINSTSVSMKTTIHLTDRATRTKTLGGMTTVTVYPNITISVPANTTQMDTKTVTNLDLSTTGVPKNATATLTDSTMVTKTASVSGESNAFNKTMQHGSQTASINTTVYITGTPMLKSVPPTTTMEKPLFPTVNGTLPVTHNSYGTGYPVSTSTSTSTMPTAFSSAEKLAEPKVFGTMTCQTCLVVFILGLLVLF